MAKVTYHGHGRTFKTVKLDGKKVGEAAQQWTQDGDALVWEFKANGARKVYRNMTEMTAAIEASA